MDNYKKIKSIGRGAFGIVYLCERISDKFRLVIKEIPVIEMSNDECQDSLNEARVHSKLNHPNVITYYESFLEEKYVIIVMEYAEGGTLYEYLQNRQGRLLEEEIVLKFFVQLVLAVQHIHSQSVLHRDLKSHNILLDRRRSIVKISDFGISKILCTKSIAETVVGTPNYISPELCEGKPYNRKSDIWALGCVLYELLTLKRPFEGDNISALVMKIMKGYYEPVCDTYSKNIRHLVSSMLSMEPSKRPDAAQIMAEPFIVPVLFHIYGSMGCLPYQPKNKVPGTSLQSSNTSSKSNGTYVYKTEISAIPSKLKVWFVESSMPMLSSFSIPDMIYNNKLARIIINKIKHQCSFLLEKSAMLIEDVPKSNYKQEFEKSLSNLFENLPAKDLMDCATGCGFSINLSKNQVVSTVGKVSSGCLGCSTNVDVKKPKIVEDMLFHNIVSIDCGPRHVLAVTEKNKLFAWGHGDKGCLGLGKYEYYSLPQIVIIPHHKVAKVFCGVDCSFAITKENIILACGSNRHNKLGMDTEDGHHIDNTAVFLPVCSEPLPNLTVVTIATGKSHTAVLTNQGEIYTFGSNRHGQLGWGNRKLSHTMPGCIKVEPVTSICCGNLFTLAVTNDGDCFLWGTGPELFHENEVKFFVKINSLPFLKNFKILQIAAHEEDIVLITKKIKNIEESACEL